MLGVIVDDTVRVKRSSSAPLKGKPEYVCFPKEHAFFKKQACTAGMVRDLKHKISIFTNNVHCKQRDVVCGSIQPFDNSVSD